QRGLAHAIGADHADAVAAMDAQGEVPDDFPLTIRGTKGKAHALGVDHLGAAAGPFGHIQLDGAKLAQLLAPLLAHAPEPLQPSDIALAPGSDAVTYPMLLLGDAALQLVAFG